MPDAPATRVLVSYRRDDTSAYAGPLYDYLSGRFGRDNVLMNLTSVAPGADLPDLRPTLASCDAVIVLIGPSWLSRGAGGERALDDPRDPVRNEVEQALTSGRLVVPLLVGGAEFPSPGELPVTLSGLAGRQAFSLSDSSWSDDVSGLSDWMAGAKTQMVDSVPPSYQPPGYPPPVFPPPDRQVGKKAWDAKRLALTVGPIALVLIVVVVLVVVSVVKKSPSAKPLPALTPHSKETLLQTVTGVPESVFDQVGLPSEISNFPAKLSGQTPLTEGQLPVMLYVGAEYCPFCAAERWAMVMALSKFGTFSNLGTISSSPTDYAPNTPTFTFYKSTYTSTYLVFRSYELATNTPALAGSSCNIDGYGCLQTQLAKTDYNLFENVGGGNFPFMDFGNQSAQSGAGFEDQPLLLANLTWDEVAAKLYDPTSSIAQAEDGSANYITAAICHMTGNNPGSVCSAPYVSAAQTAAGF